MRQLHSRESPERGYLLLSKETVIARDLRAIAYMSTARAVFGDGMLEMLLDDARAFNAKVSVTGVLFYRADAFFQYFEGPRKSVEAVYDRVRQSSSHHRIVELADAEIDQREFPAWHMGFAEVPTSALLQLSQASEVAGRRSLEESTAHKTDGILFLHSFLRA
jgi:Sensors of blue-light using FAD